MATATETYVYLPTKRLAFGVFGVHRRGGECQPGGKHGASVCDLAVFRIHHADCVLDRDHRPQQALLMVSPNLLATGDGGRTWSVLP